MTIGQTTLEVHDSSRLGERMLLLLVVEGGGVRGEMDRGRSHIILYSTEGSFHWIESKLQEENLLSRSFELNAQSPCSQ